MCSRFVKTLRPAGFILRKATSRKAPSYSASSYNASSHNASSYNASSLRASSHRASSYRTVLHKAVPHKVAPYRTTQKTTLYGLHAVEAALRARRRKLERLWLRSVPSPKWDALEALAQASATPVERRTQAELEQACASSDHQGAVLFCGPLPWVEEGTWWSALGLGEDASPALEDRQSSPFRDTQLQATRSSENSPPRAERPSGIHSGAEPTSGIPQRLLLALDRVSDPQNLGAIARSAEAFGALGIVLPARDAAPPTPAAVRVSAGALERLPLGRVANLARFLAQARKKGSWTAAAVVRGGVDVLHTPVPWPLILVLGSEGQGVRSGILRHCELHLTIPLPGTSSDSIAGLNVSAAAAVFLHALMRS